MAQLNRTVDEIAQQLAFGPPEGGPHNQGGPHNAAMRVGLAAMHSGRRRRTIWAGGSERTGGQRRARGRTSPIAVRAIEG